MLVLLNIIICMFDQAAWLYNDIILIDAADRMPHLLL